MDKRARKRIEEYDASYPGEVHIVDRFFYEPEVYPRGDEYWHWCKRARGPGNCSMCRVNRVKKTIECTECGAELEIEDFPVAFQLYLKLFKD